jgi:anionic cell wall polymer biosynthesis LytR-Cps2A-Psr (LCP) family protein
VNHYVQVDFQGFAAIVDAMGGVKMHVDRETTSPEGVYVPAGTRVLTGMQALAFVRNRHGYAAGDHQRIKNQQAFLFALARKASKERNFTRLPNIIRSVSANLQTDMNVGELVELAGKYRGIKKKNLRAKSAPVTGAMIGGGSYQILKEARFREMLKDFEAGGFEPKAKHAQNAGLK